MLAVEMGATDNDDGGCAIIEIREYVHGIGNKIIVQMMFCSPFLKNLCGIVTLCTAY